MAGFPSPTRMKVLGSFQKNDSASQGSLHSDQNQTYVVWGATRRGRLPRNARHDEPTGAPLLADRQPIARDGGCAKRAGPGPETCRLVGRGLRLFRRKATFLFGMLLFSFFFEGRPIVWLRCQLFVRVLVRRDVRTPPHPSIRTAEAFWQVVRVFPATFAVVFNIKPFGG